MAKKFIALLMVLAVLLSLAACGKAKTVTCDGCGAEIQLEPDSNITDEWIVFCKNCEEEIGPIVEPGK